MDTKSVEVYVVNLDGSDKRFADTQEQLDNAGLAFTRISAVDGRGKALTDFSDYDDAEAKKRMGRSLISSEIGCYLSHIRCLERFLQTTSDYLIVFEDDIELAEDARSTINQVMEYLEDNQHLDWYVINISARKKKLYRPLSTFNNHTLNKAFYFPILCLGMIWSRRGAEEFLKRHLPITMPIDNTLQSWLSKNGKGLSIYPPLAVSRGVESEIDGVAVTQGKKRNSKSDRHVLYTFRKQRRLLQDKTNALKNMVTGR